MALIRTILLTALCGALLACGSVDGSGSGLTLNASASGIKSITFRWPEISGATHYKLYVDPDGLSGYSQVGSDLITTSTVVSLPVHLTQWLDARYLVEAHDAVGLLATSSSIGIASLMLETIGYFKASNTGIGDTFGYRVAVSGDGTTLAVSAASDGTLLPPLMTGEDSNATGIDGSQTTDIASNSGAVYLFVRSDKGWEQQAYIKASNTQAFDAFGSSLALSSDGNTLAVGANGEGSSATGIDGAQELGTAIDAGAVYIFTRSVAVWSQQAYIKASNTQAGDAFGSSVALSSDGTTLAVGAYGEDSAATGVDGDQSADTAANAGAVYLFIRSAGTWSQQAYLKASNSGFQDLFGSRVSLSSDGNTLAVGAPGEGSAGVGIDDFLSLDTANDAGAVYLFTRSADLWSQQAYVKASNTQAFDHFGSSVALSGDGNTLVVGAVDEDSIATGIGGDQLADTAASAGAVYLFSRSGGGWGQQAYIKASNTGAFDQFGASVAMNGDGNILAVGAHQEDSIATGLDGDQEDDLATDSGALYLFTRSAGVWSVRNYIKAPNSDAFDHFGTSIALNGDGTTLAVGAIGEASSSTGVNSNPGNDDWGLAGAAYLF